MRKIREEWNENIASKLISTWENIVNTVRNNIWAIMISTGVWLWGTYYFYDDIAKAIFNVTWSERMLLMWIEKWIIEKDDILSIPVEQIVENGGEDLLLHGIKEWWFSKEDILKVDLDTYIDHWYDVLLDYLVEKKWVTMTRMYGSIEKLLEEWMNATLLHFHDANSSFLNQFSGRFTELINIHTSTSSGIDNFIAILITRNVILDDEFDSSWLTVASMLKMSLSETLRAVSENNVSIYKRWEKPASLWYKVDIWKEWLRLIFRSDDPRRFDGLLKHLIYEWLLKYSDFIDYGYSYKHLFKLKMDGSLSAFIDLWEIDDKQVRKLDQIELIEGWYTQTLRVMSYHGFYSRSLSRDAFTYKELIKYKQSWTARSFGVSGRPSKFAFRELIFLVEHLDASVLRHFFRDVQKAWKLEIDSDFIEYLIENNKDEVLVLSMNYMSNADVRAIMPELLLEKGMFRSLDKLFVKYRVNFNAENTIARTYEMHWGERFLFSHIWEWNFKIEKLSYDDIVFVAENNIKLLEVLLASTDRRFQAPINKELFFLLWVEFWIDNGVKYGRMNTSGYWILAPKTTSHTPNSSIIWQAFSEWWLTEDEYNEARSLLSQLSRQKSNFMNLMHDFSFENSSERKIVNSAINLLDLATGWRRLLVRGLVKRWVKIWVKDTLRRNYDIDNAVSDFSVDIWTDIIIDRIIWEE